MTILPLARLRAATSIAVLALATCAGVAQARPVAHRPAVHRPMPASVAVAAASTGGWGQFGVQTQFVDRSVKPGDDFNRFVNGKWIAATPIPADRTRYGSFDQLADLSEARLHTILDELAASHPAPGSRDARIGAAYAAFMDTAGIEAAGMRPARASLDRIAAARTSDDLLALFATPGFDSPIAIGVDADEKQSDRYALQLGQGGLGLPDRDYYLVDSPRNLEIRAKYLDYLTGTLTNAGYSDARGAATSVLALETDLARAMWDRTIRRDRDLTYNKLTLTELEALSPTVSMKRFIHEAGADQASYALVAQIPPTAQELTTAHITPAMAAAKIGGGVPATLTLIGGRPIATWQAYLASHFIADHAAVLPRAIDDAHFAFYGTYLQGQPVQRERWKRGIATVEGQMGELLGQIYAERYFPAANRVAMNDLVKNLRAAMAVNLAELKWMGPQTRTEALAKLNAFTPKIGSPTTYKTYDGLMVTPDDAFGNALAADKWSSAYEIGRLGRPVDRAEWGILPETINAYYNPTFNEVVFPAAILQPPFFNLTADPAINYGGIGAVIGHEMGHGFDDQGAKSDGTGNLRDWWTPADKAAFDGLTGRLVSQYNGFCPFDDGKSCVNGQLTLGENIGDLGGLSLAYRAYKMSLHGKPAPIIGGFTGDQRFFMGWAQVWRQNAREAKARQLLLTDPHSPAQYRINGIVRNFDEWYKAFAVKPGDKLYLPPAQRLRIW